MSHTSVSAVAAAPPWNEIDQAARFLEQTKKYVIGATKGLSEAQWKFKPASGGWSIAEILEHAVLTVELVLGPVRQQLDQAPVSQVIDAKQIDAMVVGQFPDRTATFHAPDPVNPTGRASGAEGITRLETGYASLRRMLDGPGLREHAVFSPPLQAISKGVYDKMDGYQWILAVTAHTERHTKQMLEVRADPNFPAK